MRFFVIEWFKRKVYMFFLTLIPLSEIGTTCFYHTVIWIRQLFSQPAACLTQPPLKLEWLLTTAKATGTKGLTCLSKHGGARDKKFWSPILWLTIETVAKLPRSHAERTNRRAIEREWYVCNCLIFTYSIHCSRGNFIETASELQFGNWFAVCHFSALNA
jgi:hypothetical protein